MKEKISSNMRYNKDFSEVFVLRNDTNGRFVSYEKLDKEMIFLHNTESKPLIGNECHTRMTVTGYSAVS